MKVIKKIIVAIACILLTIVLFLGIIILGYIFVKYYGDNSQKLSLNDVIVYTVYIVQLVVSGILSWLVYKLSKKEVERDLNNKRQEKENAVKHIRNEINYNKSILIVLKSKKININNISKNTFKTDAWERYGVILIDVMDNSQAYNKLVSYYSTIQLFNISEIREEVVENIENGDKLFKVLDETLEKIK